MNDITRSDTTREPTDGGIRRRLPPVRTVGQRLIRRLPRQLPDWRPKPPSRGSRAWSTVKAVIFITLFVTLVVAVIGPTALHSGPNGSMASGSGDQVIGIESGSTSGTLLAVFGTGMIQRAIIALLGAAVGIMSGRWLLGRTSQEPSTELSVKPEDKRVKQLLDSHGGSMRQSEIVATTGWSKAKVSRILSRMETLGIIEKEQVGRQNKISLTEGE